MVKDDIIKWWGPIIHEYYGATEGLGFTASTARNGWRIAGPSAAYCSAICISRRQHAALPAGHAGHGMVQDRNPVRIFQRPNQTREARSADAA